MDVFPCFKQAPNAIQWVNDILLKPVSGGFYPTSIIDNKLVKQKVMHRYAANEVSPLALSEAFNRLVVSYWPGFPRFFISFRLFSKRHTFAPVHHSMVPYLAMILVHRLFRSLNKSSLQGFSPSYMV